MQYLIFSFISLIERALSEHCKSIILQYDCKKIRGHHDNWWKPHFFFFLLFRAVPKTYEGSQARGQTTATALWDLSHICNLYHSSWQSWIPKPLSKARDQTHIFIDTSWIHFHCTTTGTPEGQLLHFFYFIILIFKVV